MKYHILKMQIKNFKFSFILLFTILFIGIFLRFFELEKRFVFDIDVMYQALYAKTILKDFHIIWIGVSASNIGYYLGPGLVYLTATLLKIYNDPISLAFFTSSIGTLTILSIYYVSRKLFNEKIALISSAVYSFTLYISNYDRKFWPILIPLVGIWMYYGLVKTKNNINFLLLLSLLIGVSFHVHLSLLLFVPLIIFAAIRNFEKKYWMTYLISFIIYLFATSPLIVYDFVHNFDNLLAPIKFMTIKNPNTSFYASLQNKFSSITQSIVSLIILISILFKKGSVKINYLKAIVGIFVLAILLYPGPFQQYYVTFIFPFFALVVAILFEKINSKILVFIIALYAVFNVYSFLNIKNIKELSYKKNVINKICPTLNTGYRLVVGQNGRDYNGWYYLFTQYCKRPDNSDVDSMFGWLYQSEIKDQKNNQVIIYPNQLK